MQLLFLTMLDDGISDFSMKRAFQRYPTIMAVFPSLIKITHSNMLSLSLYKIIQTDNNIIISTLG